MAAIPKGRTAVLEGPVIHQITLVDCVTRSELGYFRSVSLPGHLLHLVIEGEVEQYVDGRVQRIKAGHTVWYHENAEVVGRIIKAPWRFYTVNFSAPTLPPPPDYQRVIKVSQNTTDRFAALYDMWCRVDSPAMARHLRLHALLLELLLDAICRESLHHRIDSATCEWWALEQELRRNLDLPIDLNLMAKLSRRSHRTITRMCYAATGMPPMKRVKEIRLSYARGLVLYSRLTISEIAFRVGYSRVQELSRDYHRHFGVTPTQDRESGSRYRERESVSKETLERIKGVRDAL